MTGSQWRTKKQKAHKLSRTRGFLDCDAV